ncbi:MAG: DNA-3-methyladenine glycosylase [Nitrospirales bacterium]|nr:DNA-3-methyladenine glycosylase [Nitrospirales bacterium]
MILPQPLPQSFFHRPTLHVAKDLLGKYLIREGEHHACVVRIVDVEAYVGPEDRACHASKGRTKRTEVLFGPPGMTYVYLIYGMYHCFNLVTERIDFPAAVLIRGIEVDGPGVPSDRVRINGPGRVSRHLNIDRTLNAWDATLGQALWIEDRGERIPPRQIQALPRIGIDYAGTWAAKPWRFCLPDHTNPPQKRTRQRRATTRGKSELS